MATNPSRLRPRPPRVPAFGAVVTVGALTVGLVGCRDSPTDPLAALVTPETAPALQVDAVLPLLPDLAARTGTEARLSDPIMRWVGSWNDPDGGEARRRGAVAEAAPVLGDALGTGGAAQALAPLLQVARALEAFDDAPPELRPVLADVRDRSARVRRSLDADRPGDALHEGLVAADRLREASPEQVARALVARGERWLAEAGEHDAAHADRERGTMLLERARQALEAGDYPRAVQRAFYACQLLGGV